jgi:hypothetical protein
MTTVLAIRNRAAGDTISPASRLPGLYRLGYCGPVDFFGARRATLHGLPRPTRALPYLAAESDDFENRDHLHWWSHGAFTRNGQLYGNQYLAGRRAPPLLHR